jgi:dUTP pyrophosphatase
MPWNGLEVRVKLLDPLWNDLNLAGATSDSAGLDLPACIETESVDVEPGERIKVPSGIAVEIAHPGVAGFVFSRSGLGAKEGLTVAQGVGVVDPDYRGEIIVWLLNTSKTTLTVTRGQRVAQLLFLPFHAPRFLVVPDLGRTTRGDGGFGHTGR